MKRLLVCLSTIAMLLSYQGTAQTEQPPAADPDAPKETIRESKPKVKISTKKRSKVDYRRPSGVGGNIYGGLVGGYSASAASLGDDEPERSGYQMGVRAMATIFSGAFGIGMGIGWFQNKLSYDSSSYTPDETLDADDVRRQESVISRAVFFEFFPHFRPTEEIQIGPIAHMALGPYNLYLPGEDQKGQTILAGVMAAYEYQNEDWFYRGFFEYLTEINIEPRSIQNILVGFDVGRAFRERYSTVVKRTRTERHRTIVEKVIEKPVERKVETKQVALVFDDKMINFVTAKSELLPASQQRIQRLAQFLKTNPLLWSKVIIEGHTDRRGTMEYNMKLSTDRAVSVGQELTRNGVDARRITWIGLGPTRPIDPQDNELAWARNRRVEIKFDGVTDESALRSGVGAAMSD